MIAELQRRFGELMSERLDAIGDRSLTVDEIAKPVGEVGREADSRLEERLIEEQSPPAENCATCPCCGERARYKETRHTWLLTTHGARSLPRPYYYCRRRRHGFSPMDAILELAVGRNATRRVRRWMAKDGAQEKSFAGAPPILMELPGARLRVLVVPGDGAARAPAGECWKLVRQHFPRSVQILDFRHVIGHLWTIAEARFGGRENDAARTWVRAAHLLLEEDHLDAVIGDIGDWKPRLLKHRKLRDREVAFLRRNRHRLLYGTFLKEGLMVGSDVIESRCKQVVQRRLHGAGMHWREQTAEAVLAIRVLLREAGPRDQRVYAESGACPEAESHPRSEWRRPEVSRPVAFDEPRGGAQVSTRPAKPAAGSRSRGSGRGVIHG